MAVIEFSFSRSLSSSFPFLLTAVLAFLFPLCCDKVAQFFFFSPSFAFLANSLLPFLLDFVLFSVLLFVCFPSFSPPPKPLCSLATCAFSAGGRRKKLICKFCLWRKNIYNKLNLQPKRTEPSRNETKRNGAQQKANKMLDKLRIRRLVAAWQMKMLIGFPCLLAAPSMKPAKLAYLIRLASASCLPSKWCVVAGKKGQKYMQHHKLQQCGQPSRAPPGDTTWKQREVYAFCAECGQCGERGANCQPISALLKFFAWKTINRKQFHCCQRGQEQEYGQIHKDLPKLGASSCCSKRRQRSGSKRGCIRRGGCQHVGPAATT